ncbi:MAG: FAD:protein FMN transferase, partial [Clostridia bacterium]|nr:FAD:protein FMN transferase [Clostridia bacterium]
MNSKAQSKPEHKLKYILIAVTAALVIAAGAVVSIWLSKPNITASSEKAEGTLFAMDTYMTFAAYGENGKDAIENAKKLIQDCEALWSVTDENSEIGRLNLTGTLVASSETVRLLTFAKEYCAYTNGCFNPAVYPLVRAWGFTTGEYRVPDESEINALLNSVDIDNLKIKGNTVTLEPSAMIDLGGIAKGYAGDLVIDSFRTRGINSALISLGGNVQALGTKPDGSAWKIGIQSPYDNALIGVVDVIDKCVITSGVYERYFVAEDGTVYGHIISPFTGKPASKGLVSVTVICDRGSFADALSTSLFVMGTEDAIEFWRTHEGFDIVLMSDDGTVYVSEGVFGAYT